MKHEMLSCLFATCNVDLVQQKVDPTTFHVQLSQTGLIDAYVIRIKRDLKNHLVEWRNYASDLSQRRNRTRWLHLQLLTGCTLSWQQPQGQFLAETPAEGEHYSGCCNHGGVAKTGGHQLPQCRCPLRNREQQDSPV